MDDINKATDALVNTLLQQDIDIMLKTKMLLYITKSFQSEEVLDTNCLILGTYTFAIEGDNPKVKELHRNDTSYK